MTLLIVGAHAMDAEIMAGALAAKAANDGHRVTLLHLTRGERGHPTKPPGQFGRQLESEMTAAAAILGVEQRWSGLEAPLPEPDLVIPIVGSVLAELRPDLVVTHWRGSWHRSHRRTHDATITAVEESGGFPTLFAENCEDLDGFCPDCFVPIGDVYDTWLDALSSYELFRRSAPGSGHQSAIPYWAYYTAAASVRGLQAGLGRAAALMSAPGLRSPPGFGVICS